MSAEGPILFFDGVCNVCDASVQFILRYEHGNDLRFAPLQSEIAKAVLHPLGVRAADLDTVVLVRDGRAYLRSAAFFEVLRYLKQPWRLLRVLVAVPRPIRDFCYDAFARIRYRVFGKKDACMIPSPSQRARFLS